MTTSIRKDYPTTGVLKQPPCVILGTSLKNQEGLPDYWGIETLLLPALLGQSASGFDQEGLPAYWGILLVNGNAA